VPELTLNIVVRLSKPYLEICMFQGQSRELSTRNFLTFVKTTAIAYGQKIGRSLKILVLCNSSRFYKRQAITSTGCLWLWIPPSAFGVF